VRAWGVAPCSCTAVVLEQSRAVLFQKDFA
jgi:hypothetical protein